MRIEEERAMFREAMRNPRTAMVAHAKLDWPAWIDCKFVDGKITVLRPCSVFVHAPAVVVSEKELKIKYQSIMFTGGLYVYYIEDGANVLAELSEDPAIRSEQEDTVLR